MPRPLDLLLFENALRDGMKVVVIDRCENYVLCALEASLELDGEMPLMRLTEAQVKQLQ